MRWLWGSAGIWLCVLAASLPAQQVRPSGRAAAPDAQADPAASRAAYFVRSLDNPRDRRESRGDILDTPVFPGSVVKTVALVAALESGIITANSSRMCRRVVKADGETYTCSHPDLKRALSPAEALAYSCNDFFVSLAPRLSRDVLNRTRIAAGLPPVAADVPMSKAILGLAGPKTTPRSLIDVMARLAAAGKDAPVPMKPDTRAVLVDGMTGSAQFGTASAFKTAGVSALAKTGTIVMPTGTPLGLVVALSPVERPSRAIVVAAPGAAGLDAASIASDLLKTTVATTPTIRLGRTQADGSTKVETIAIDDYIAQVLAGEGQPKAGDAAQQALAITARTFALANRNRHRAEGFDLCDTTHCQVVRTSTSVTRRAADATSGRVLLFQGQPASVFYSAWCGGKSELASQVWPGAVDYSYEPSVHDEACEDEPGWSSDVRVDQIERALKAAGLRGTRLKGVRVLSRNASDRVVRVGLDGFTPNEMTGHEFRMAVGRVAGWASIKSTAFEVDRTSTGFRFRGKGFGHGVGLCVVGAGKRALQGATADQILKFYFPGLTLGAIPGTVPMTTTTAAPGQPAPGGAKPSVVVPAPAPVPPSPPAVADVALALPGNEEGERSVVLSLIRRSRDEIAKLTGAVAPAKLKVTVHPSVDSFNRATGQPWWVSGATAGAEIDLLPITVLRQQGQLERTIRHEVTHALLDAALAKRPMWVREGAAAYFARPDGSSSKPARVECPSDLELTRPLSAGAQRDAYARAEACFARAMADGKKWADVR